MVENIIPNKNGILINVTEFKKPTTHCLCRNYAWNLITCICECNKHCDTDDYS